MKKFIEMIKIPLASLWLAVVTILALLNCQARAQVTITTTYPLTNLPAGPLPGGAQTNLFSVTNITGGFTGPSGVLIAPTNNIIPLWQGSGMSFTYTIITTNAPSATNYVSLLLSVSPDGTNWWFLSTNSMPLVYMIPYATGTNMGGTNLPPAQLNNYQYISPYAFYVGGASTNYIIVTNVVASHAYTTSPLQ